MGRGLSSLQRSILMLAAQNRIAGVPNPEKGLESTDLTPAEVYVTLFSWECHGKGWRSGPRSGGKHFDPDKIGREKYNAVRASVNRAFRRLQQRGCVERWAGAYAKWSGIALTADGLGLAKAMLSAGELPQKQPA